LFPAPIDGYSAPDSLEEALASFATFGEDTHFIAGGQSLMQAIKSRMVRPHALVDLQRVAELRELAQSPAGMSVGAMVRYRTLADLTYPSAAHAALKDAACHVGDRQVRNRGTLGGSICWNFIAACMPAVSLALGANLILAETSGRRRTVAIDKFLRGPLDTDRREGELLLRIEFPAAVRSGSAYRKWSPVTDGLPVIGVCASVEIDAKGRCANARIAISGLGAGPVRAGDAERALLGATPHSAEAFDAASRAAAASADVHSDPWATADYRRELIASLGREVIATAMQRARQEA
jgi:carbon-monoxide dehydrogenase medium subunit